MIPLDLRHRRILTQLLRSSTPLTSVELALQLGLSVRVVRSCLPGIRTWLQARGASLAKGTSHELFIDASSRVKSQLGRELERATGWRLLLSPTERLHLAALMVLTSEEPLLVKRLESQLGVSRPTALRDLDRVEQWLSGRKLALIRRPNYGVEAEGREQDRREAIVSIFLESVGEMLLLALCADSIAVLQWRAKGEVGPLRTLLENLDLTYARKLLDSSSRKLQLQFADRAYVSLILHLALLIKRVQQHRTVEVSPESPTVLTSEWASQTAKAMAEQIELRFDIALPESEVAFIATQLSASTTAGAQSDMAAGADLRGVDPALLETVRRMLAEASAYLYPSLATDESLIRGLALHLQPIHDRLRLGVPIRNPLLDEVREEYPYVFKVARRTSSILEQAVGMPIPEEEIGYIAMHLGAAMERLRRLPGVKKRVFVVCGEGTATAWLLVSKLRAELPELEIVGVMSLLELRRSRVLHTEIDAIIATIPIKAEDAPVVVVRPVLGLQDVATLRRSLGLGSIPSLRQEADLQKATGASLSSLITPETIRLKMAASTWQEVVDRSAEPLLALGAIEPSYVEAMKAVIVRYGPYAVSRPGVVLLHALPGDGIRRLCLSLATFTRPVYFGHPDNDPVDVAFVLAALDNYSHMRALGELAVLLGDEGALQSIRSGSDEKEIIAVISRALANKNAANAD